MLTDPGRDAGHLAAQPAVATAPGVIPLLRRGAWHVSADREPPARPGLPAVSLAPQILIRTDARHLRGRPGPRLTDRAGRARVLAAAWQRFTSGQVHLAGADPQGYAAFSELLWRAAGLPAVLVDRWCRLLGDQLAALFAGAGPGEHATGAGTPLGLVALPGNTFTCLYSVFEAALAGMAVWIRPSSREPFSALRLVCAMLEEGWPAELAGYYPSGRDVLPTMVEVTDRQVIYGGRDVAAAVGGTPTAEVHGPLRVCAVVPAGADPDLAAERLRDLAAADAGRFCTALRAILCLGDPAPVAAGLAARLDAIPLAPPDPRLPMAASPDRGRAAATAAFIQAHLAGAGQLTRRPLLAEAGGATYLAPALVSLPAAPAGEVSWDGGHPLFGLEVPFPFATIMAVSADQAARLSGHADVTHQVEADEHDGSPQ
ncbi:MAG TPA: aldehyde dehydrogenase family protein [Streptosporangiaceae bacterium]|nr:aldehyde dehydrogenase family protein [Streptosporangiaceae bacterium]